jgi:hypothetical protein
MASSFPVGAVGAMVPFLASLVHWQFFSRELAGRREEKVKERAASEMMGID